MDLSNIFFLFQINYQTMDLNESFSQNWEEMNVSSLDKSTDRSSADPKYTYQASTRIVLLIGKDILQYQRYLTMDIIKAQGT